jgi:glycerophosphoryl diester phosphodiesterase
MSPLLVLRRRTLGGGLVALLALVAVGWAVVMVADGPDGGSPSQAALFLWPSPPLVVSAGGAPGAPPDTLPAYRLALQGGFQALEAPLRFTGEGEPVACRAEDVGATTDGQGRVDRLSLAELQALDAGYRFASATGGHPFRGHGLQLPLLEEVLAAFPGVPLLVEVVDPAPSPAALDRLARVIKRWEVSGTILLGASRAEVAAALRRAVPGAPSLSTPRETAVFLRLAGLGLATWARPAYRVLRVIPGKEGRLALTAAQVEAAHRRGLAVLAGPVATPAEARRLADLGVDALLSSVPLPPPTRSPARPGG